MKSIKLSHVVIFLTLHFLLQFTYAIFEHGVYVIKYDRDKLLDPRYYNYAELQKQNCRQINGYKEKQTANYNIPGGMPIPSSGAAKAAAAPIPESE